MWQNYQIEIYLKEIKTCEENQKKNDEIINYYFFLFAQLSPDIYNLINRII